jgi:hypothetical protein
MRLHIPAEAIIAALREAHAKVPIEERTTYVMRRLSEWRREQEERPVAEVVPFTRPSGPVPFSQIADDPVIARLCREER